jgi:uncharacterized protein (DUF1015 family)
MAMTDQPDEQLAEIAVDAGAYDESRPALYVYGQRDDEGAYTGVVCEVGVQAFLDGRVRGHEAVQPERVEALIRHHVTTDGPPALVTLLHRAGPAFMQALRATAATEPILDFDGPRGVRQTLWRMADGPSTGALTEELAAAELYIADGHHRVTAALEEWRLAGKPGGTGLLCVVHPMHDLRVSAFHRRVVGPLELADLGALLTADFEIQAVAQRPAQTPGSIGMYVERSWHRLTYRGTRGPGPAGLDVAVLEATFARAQDRERTPAYAVEIAPAETTIDELTRSCDADRGALFTLAPPPLEVVTGLADAGEVMPPKTTYFAPKPCAGIILRP